MNDARSWTNSEDMHYDNNLSNDERGPSEVQLRFADPDIATEHIGFENRRPGANEELIIEHTPIFSPCVTPPHSPSKWDDIYSFGEDEQRAIANIKTRELLYKKETQHAFKEYKN